MMGWGQGTEISRESYPFLYPFVFSPDHLLPWWPTLLGMQTSEPEREASGLRIQKSGSVPGNPGFQPTHFVLLNLSFSTCEMGMAFFAQPPTRRGGVLGRRERFVHVRKLSGSASLTELRSVSPAPALPPGSAWASSAAAPRHLGMVVTSPLPLLCLPLWPSLPFLHGFSGTGQKAAPLARLGLQKSSRFGTAEPRGSRSPKGKRFTFCGPSGHGARVPGRASRLQCFAEGTGAGGPPPAQKALSWGGRRSFCGAGAAFAEALGRATAALCTREVCLGAAICLANREPVPLPPIHTWSCPQLWSFPVQPDPWGRPGAWNLGLKDAEEGNVGVMGRETCKFWSSTRI